MPRKLPSHGLLPSSSERPQAGLGLGPVRHKSSVPPHGLGGHAVPEGDGRYPPSRRGKGWGSAAAGGCITADRFCPSESDGLVFPAELLSGFDQLGSLRPWHQTKPWLADLVIKLVLRQKFSLKRANWWCFRCVSSLQITLSLTHWQTDSLKLLPQDITSGNTEPASTVLDGSSILALPSL